MISVWTLKVYEGGDMLMIGIGSSDCKQINGYAFFSNGTLYGWYGLLGTLEGRTHRSVDVKFGPGDTIKMELNVAKKLQI